MSLFSCQMKWFLTKCKTLQPNVSVLGIPLCAITYHYLNTGTGDAWARHNRDMADLWGVTSLLEPTLLSFSVGATLVWGSVRSYNKTRVCQWCQQGTFQKGQCYYIFMLWQPMSINLRKVLIIWSLKYIWIIYTKMQFLLHRKHTAFLLQTPIR